MKANEFVKKFGWDWAKKIANDAGEKHYSFNVDISAWQQFPSPDCDYVVIKDLKRLVESWELVEKLGGLVIAKKVLGKSEGLWADLTKSFLLRSGITIDSLKQAIADVESC